MTLPPLYSFDSALMAAGVFLLLVSLVWIEQRIYRRAQVRDRFERARSGLTPNHRPNAVLAVSIQLRTGFATLVRIANSLRFLGSSRRDEARLLLQSAGIRSRASVSNYFGAKLLAAGSGASAALVAIMQGVFAANSFLQVALVIGGFFIGGLAPELALKWWARRRQGMIRASLPDAIDLLIIATNAGQSLEVALGRVEAEISRASPVLGEELRVTKSELRALPNRKQALENFAVRTGIEEVRSLTSTLIQTVRYGTPLTQSLKILATEQRGAKILRLEEKAAKLPAILSLPLMLLIMPSIFIVTAGPALLSIGDALFGS